MAGIYGGPTMNYNSGGGKDYGTTGKKMVSNNVNVSNKLANQFGNSNT